MTLYDDLTSMNQINQQQIIEDYNAYEGEFGQ